MAADLRVDWWSERVLVLTIDRPKRRNPVDHELLSALATELETNGAKAGAIVLRGAGGAAFSAGFDLDQIHGTEADLDADQSIGRAVDAITSSPAPVISMIQGHCHGAGVELALSCDLRVAADDLQLSLQAVSLGVVYRYQLISRLVEIAGLGRAADLLLARPVLGAPEALAWGLVTEVVPAGDIDRRTRELAEMLAASPRSAVEGTKASLQLAARHEPRENAMDQTRLMRRHAAVSPERRTALEAAKKRLGS
ncbi:MAG TPA: enoyl-CoA hydratase/isomerase family protein [Candidatus Dormibacteraeota bacterium]|nr:enoyl-CoA hydratase/isomerase family protein [Candidatus Dormibacteraeota bacterium]